jgi:hypothetical protein
MDGPNDDAPVPTRQREQPESAVDSIFDHWPFPEVKERPRNVAQVRRVARSRGTRDVLELRGKNPLLVLTAFIPADYIAPTTARRPLSA